MSFDIEKKSKELESIIDSINTPIVHIDEDFKIQRINQSSLKFFESTNYLEFIDSKCYVKLYKRNEICPFCPFQEIKKEKLELKDLFIEKNEIHKDILFNKQNFKLSFFPVLIQGNINSFTEIITNQTSNLEKEEEKLKFRNLASLGVMISGVAHELNNPLTGISLTVQNLMNNLGHLSVDFLKNRLDMIRNDLEKASNVVKDIINFSKPEKQKFHLTEINTLIKKSKDASVRLYPDLSKNITWEINSDFEYIFYFDPLKIERVFLNLFRNSLQAFDYSKGQIRVDIKKKKNNILISIEDNAGGIDESMIDKIFDPFFSKKDSLGTGLGLSICFSIITEHNGKITAKSKDDRTKFLISLPYLKKE